jgi:uncharacterized membrane protein (DUF4010 family)
MDLGPYWLYADTLIPLVLALGVGLFVGLERERRGKEAGLRTFSLVAVLGALGGLLGTAYGLLSLGLVAVLVVFLNLDTLRRDEGVELTTSVALLVTAAAGVLSGHGDYFAAVAVGIVTAGLLSWKEGLVDFSLGLTDKEIRAAILLGLLAFVVYPGLPDAPLDPWGLVAPRSAWLTVVLVAAIGFANYVLVKLYGSRGVELAGFLGGFVNSTVTVTEMAQRARQSGGGLDDLAYRGILLATAAMVVRNGLLLAILAPAAFGAVVVPLALMLLSSLALALLRRHATPAVEPPVAQSLSLESPFSLPSALKFGLMFLALEIAGGLAQAAVGDLGFYAVSTVGGLVSSGSAVASAASLAAQGTIAPAVAGTGALLASLASVLVNVPLVDRVAHDRQLTLRLGGSLLVTAILGLAGVVLQATVLPAVPLPPRLM